MMMNPAQKRAQLNREAILSASPARLLTMLYDRLMLDLNRAEAAQQAGATAVATENLVHAQDIRQPLGLTRVPEVRALTPVAEFYARRDFAVPSHTNSKGLRLKAEDGPFMAGKGPLVTGTTLALVMVMAGRSPYLRELRGPGVPILRSRLEGKDTALPANG